ncbi:hypothetical protein D3C77_773550 [compost metagenome]
MLKTFYRLGRENGAGGLQNVQWLAQTFLQSALDGPDAWQSIDQLAEKIRAGKATDEAILEMLIVQKAEEIPAG